ncbi:MAG: hypothetical protein WAV40_01835 [Microgenomates group bacterium]
MKNKINEVEPYSLPELDVVSSAKNWWEENAGWLFLGGAGVASLIILVDAAIRAYGS